MRVRAFGRGAAFFRVCWGGNNTGPLHGRGGGPVALCTQNNLSGGGGSVTEWRWPPGHCANTRWVYEGSGLKGPDLSSEIWATLNRPNQFQASTSTLSLRWPYRPAVPHCCPTLTWPRRSLIQFWNVSWWLIGVPGWGYTPRVAPASFEPPACWRGRLESVDCWLIANLNLKTLGGKLKPVSSSWE